MEINDIKNLGTITVPFGGRTNYENFHQGVDVANDKGTNIKAPVDGVVVDSVKNKKNGDRGFGNLVAIVDKNGDRHQLGHLDFNAVNKGDRVYGGKTIVGTMGDSGSAYSKSGKGKKSQLDYRISTAYKKYKNPMTYLKNIG